ncbi:hypothetical protein E2320_013239 [Naja naja]|nr:hypothetical protein E2320_013239 [Naja naja]
MEATPAICKMDAENHTANSMESTVQDNFKPQSRGHRLRNLGDQIASLCSYIRVTRPRGKALRTLQTDSEKGNVMLDSCSSFQNVNFFCFIHGTVNLAFRKPAQTPDDKAAGS